MRLPKNWHGITIAQYQEINKVQKSSLDEVDKWCHILAILTDKQVDYFQQIDIGKLKKYFSKVAWINADEFYASKRKYVFHKGKLYKATTDAKDFNFARYVEIKTFLGRGEVIEQLHNLCASIYAPLTIKGFIADAETHAQRTKDFLSMPVGTIYPVVFFYSKVWNISINRMLESGIKEAEKMNKEAEELLLETLRETLENIGDGTAQLTN